MIQLISNEWNAMYYMIKSKQERENKFFTFLVVQTGYFWDIYVRDQPDETHHYSHI